MPRSLRARIVASLTLAAAAACSNGGTEPEPITGVIVLAGGAGTDSVLTLRSQSLLVEVRDSTGALMPETVVRFEALPTPGARTPYERGVHFCPVADPTCDFAQPVLSVPTNGVGRASVQVRHGTLAGTAKVRIAVPDLGIADTIAYETTAGAPVSTGLATSDTTIMIGQSVTLPATLARFDRFGNEAGTVAATVVSSTPNLTRAQQTVTGARVGAGLVVLAAGDLRDTLAVSVVPAGRLALALNSTIVVANFAGGERREYAGLSAVAQYGLHPAWVPGTDRLIVHSEGADVRLHSLDLSDGRITALPKSSTLAAEWYPGVANGFIWFMGESTSGTYAMWRMKVDGSELAPIGPTNPDYGAYYRPQVSPDGSKIVVSVISGSIGVRVFSYPAMTPLSDFVPNATSPRWSPDGQSVAFSSPGAGPIRVMRADGTQLRTIAAGTTFGEWFDWTADGSYLVALTPGRMAVVDVATGEVTPLTWTAGMWQPAVKR